MGDTPERKDFLANLKAPIPLGRKLLLFVHNSFLKVWHRQACCGHAGEPGC